MDELREQLAMLGEEWDCEEEFEEQEAPAEQVRPWGHRGWD